MNDDPRIVALDVGVKTVGVALSDPLRLFAVPLGTVRRGQSIHDDIAALRRMLEPYSVERFVLGWPLMADGTESDNLPVVKGFEKKLKAAFPNVPLQHEDEFLSTRTAREKISYHSRHDRSDKTSGRLDAAAAGVILECYLRRISVSGRQ